MSIILQLHHIISSFDRPKVAALEKYISSSYFSVKEEVAALIFLCIQSELPEEADEKTVKKTLQNPSSSLLKQCLDVLIQFIQQYEFDQLSTLKANANLAGIRKNNIEKLYKDTLSTIEKLPVTEFDQSSDFFYYRSLIEKNIFELKTENEKKNAKVKIASELNMHKISENVDVFYILEILKLAILTATESPESIPDIQQKPEVVFSLNAGKRYESQIPVIFVYRRLWEILSDPDTAPKEIEEWLSFFENIQHKIPDQEVEILKKGEQYITKKTT